MKMNDNSGEVSSNAFTSKDLANMLNPEHYEHLSLDTQDKLRRSGITAGPIAVRGASQADTNLPPFKWDDMAHDAPDAEIPADLE